jgi:hypothetical protein
LTDGCRREIQRKSGFTPDISSRLRHIRRSAPTVSTITFRVTPVHKLP